MTDDIHFNILLKKITNNLSRISSYRNNNISDSLEFADKIIEKHAFTKISYISKLKSGKYRVLSEKGRNLGTYNSRGAAEKRLRQVEYFKHRDMSAASDGKEIIDLSSLELTYSNIMRELINSHDENVINLFSKTYKKFFDIGYIDGEKNIIEFAINNALNELNSTYDIEYPKIKFANYTNESDNVKNVGKYMADIIKFMTGKIGKDTREGALNRLRTKIYNMNAIEIGNKQMPVSASLGQAITFVKTVLFGKHPEYVRTVLTEIARNLP